MTVIDCTGTGFDRGLAHGEGARDGVREAIARWEKATLDILPHERSIETYANRFLTQTGLLATATGRFPDLAEEMRGIAEGAGLPFSLVAAYNLMDEQWWYDLGAASAEPGCSTFSVTQDGRTLLAQNMDLPAFMDGSQLALRIRQPGVEECLALTSAGLIGLNGISRAGFAVCVNTLLMLNHNPSGMPVAFVVRSALACASAAEAVRHVQSLSHASGQHYAIADSQGATSLECSAEGVVVTHRPGTGRMIHTNHPLGSTDIDPATLPVLESRGRVANSRIRYGVLEDVVGSIASAEDIVSLLSDPATPLCMTTTPLGTLQTFASVLYELGDTPSAQFCLGRPQTAAWQLLSFTN